jgi:dynein assembly factor 3
VYEEEPENLARHILLLSVLLDGSVLPKERMEFFLELHSNAMLRERTAIYLGELSKVKVSFLQNS